MTMNPKDCSQCITAFASFFRAQEGAGCGDPKAAGCGGWEGGRAAQPGGEAQQGEPGGRGGARRQPRQEVQGWMAGVTNKVDVKSWIEVDFPGFQKGLLSYRSILQSSRENRSVPYSFIFSFSWTNFSYLDPATLTHFKPVPDPHFLSGLRIHIHCIGNYGSSISKKFRIWILRLKMSNFLIKFKSCLIYVSL